MQEDQKPVARSAGLGLLSVIFTILRFLCKCKPGYEGQFCESWIDVCARDPCHQRATECTSIMGTDFNCKCPSGYGGKTCAEEIDECASHPCRAPDATCIDSVGSFKCNCPIGYTGVVCEDVPCHSDPCKNSGTCVEGDVGVYSCVCRSGFKGVHCQMTMHPCQSNPCKI